MRRLAELKHIDVSAAGDENPERIAMVYTNANYDVGENVDVTEDPGCFRPPESFLPDQINRAFDDPNTAKPIALKFDPSSYWDGNYNRYLFDLEGSARTFRCAVERWRKNRKAIRIENPDASGMSEIPLNIRYETMMYVLLV